MRLETFSAELPDPFALAGEVVRQVAPFLAADDPGRFSEDVFLLPASAERNAWVFLQDGEGAIFFHAGLLTSLWDALVELIFRSPTFGRFFDWPDASGGPDWSGPYGRRETYLLELYGRAVEFILFHEAAHLARGHIPLLKARQGRSFVDERLHMSPHAGEAGELLRLIEYDADAIALEWVLNLNAWHRRRGGETTGHEDRDYMRSELMLRILACDAVFMTLDHDRPQAGPVPLTLTHPPSIHRAIRCSVLLQDTVCALSAVSAAEAASLAAASVAEITALAGRLSFAPGRWHHTHRAWLMLDQLTQDANAANAFSRQISESVEKPR